jgi:hypothetical protein
MSQPGLLLKPVAVSGSALLPIRRQSRRHKVAPRNWRYTRQRVTPALHFTLNEHRDHRGGRIGDCSRQARHRGRLPESPRRASIQRKTTGFPIEKVYARSNLEVAAALTHRSASADCQDEITRWLPSYLWGCDSHSPLGLVMLRFSLSNWPYGVYRSE